MTSNNILHNYLLKLVTATKWSKGVPGMAFCSESFKNLKLRYKYHQNVCFISSSLHLPIMIIETGCVLGNRVYIHVSI